MKNTISVKIIICGILLFTSLYLSAQQQAITPLYADNHQILLNGTWKFKYISGIIAGEDSLFYKNDFDTSRWSDIKVPGHWDPPGLCRAYLWPSR